MSGKFVDARNLVRGAVVAGLLATFGMASSAYAVANPPGSPQEQAAISALAGKILAAIQSLPANSSEGAFEGAIIDATQGADPATVLAALRQVKGTPGLPANAMASLDLAARSYADNGNVNGTGAVGTGALGATPGTGTPGFASGGGGGTTSTYTTK